MDYPPGETSLLRAVGAALSNWSLVELQLSGLFCNLSRIEQRQARAIFDGIISFEVRLGICDRLMAFQPVSELEAEMWTRLSARLSKFYKKRHELAHFSVLHSDSGAVAIAPFLTSAAIGGKVRELSTDQIRERSGKFIELHMAVHWFATRAFHGSSRPPAESPDPQEPPLVPRLRDAASQILEAKKQQNTIPQG